MSCTTTYQGLLQLHCSFPENVGKFKAFAAYFTPNAGNERLIGKCVQLEELECDYEAGFSGKIPPDGTGAIITLPDSFKRETGQFRCAVPGLPDVKSCQWAPSETNINGGHSSTGAPAQLDNKLLLVKEYGNSQNGESSPGVNMVAAMAGSTALTLFILMIGIVLVRKFKFKGRGDFRSNVRSKNVDKVVEESSTTFTTGLLSRDSTRDQNRAQAEDFTTKARPDDNSSGWARTDNEPCISSPDASINNVEQLGNSPEALIMSQDQARLLGMKDPRVFLAGPPGTGKTRVLLRKGREWLRCGTDVFVVSTSEESRDACIILYRLLQQTPNPAAGPLGRPYFYEYNLNDEEILQRAVNELSNLATKEGSLHVIADNVMIGNGSSFNTFCEKLLTSVSPSRLYLWAASDYPEDHDIMHFEWNRECLTKPLHFPPSVVRELDEEKTETELSQLAYSRKDVLASTDSKPLKHRGQLAEPGRILHV